MSTIISVILNGVDYPGAIRQRRKLKVTSTFDNDSVQANITFSTLNFVGEAKKAIDDWMDPEGNNKATEGMPCKIVISNNDDTSLDISEEYYLNLRDHKELSDVECEVTLNKDNGLNSLDERAKDITMQLLKVKGVLNDTDWVRMPYVVENRKRLLEFVQMQMQLFIISKSIKDEVFKLQNIVSDIASGLWFTTVFAGIQAIVNLVTTLINLVILTVRLVKLLKDMQEAIFPMVRYHNSINLKNWVTKALDYLDYEFSTSTEFSNDLDFVTMFGSKDDQVGTLAATVELGDIIGFIDGEIPGDGILSPNDFGYDLNETFELMNRIFFTKIAVIDGTVHIRPFNDPFWVTSAGYIFPNVKIETSITNATGTKRRNYEDMVNRHTVEWAKDDTDLHTLTNADSRIAEYIYSPISVDEQKRVLFAPRDKVQIEWALGLRKQPSDKLFGFFEKLSELYDTLQDTMQDLYDTFPELGESALPDFIEFIGSVFVRSGAVVVENHFFKVPKMVWLDPETGRIPEDFVDHLGADALFTKYHSYKGFVKGVKNPAKPNETNQKIVYEKVRIPFGPNDHEQTSTNSYFTFEDGDIGKFTNIEWEPEGDFAIVDFYIFKNWNDNLQGQLVDFAENITG